MEPRLTATEMGFCHMGRLSVTRLSPDTSEHTSP